MKDLLMSKIETNHDATYSIIVDKIKNNLNSYEQILNFPNYIHEYIFENLPEKTPVYVNVYKKYIIPEIRKTTECTIKEARENIFKGQAIFLNDDLSIVDSHSPVWSVNTNTDFYTRFLMGTMLIENKNIKYAYRMEGYSKHSSPRTVHDMYNYDRFQNTFYDCINIYKSWKYSFNKTKILNYKIENFNEFNNYLYQLHTIDNLITSINKKFGSFNSFTENFKECLAKKE